MGWVNPFRLTQPHPWVRLKRFFGSCVVFGFKSCGLGCCIVSWVGYGFEKKVLIQKICTVIQLLPILTQYEIMNTIHCHINNPAIIATQ